MEEVFTPEEQEQMKEIIREILREIIKNKEQNVSESAILEKAMDEFYRRRRSH